MNKHLIYLDYAAATPLDKRVAKAIQPYQQKQFYNPSALYSSARQVHRAYEAARASVAQILGARPSEIIITAGATESINLAIQGVAKSTPGAVIISAIEHESVIEAAKAATAKPVYCPVKPSGLIDLVRLKDLITDSVVLVSIGYVNSEIGVIQPLRHVSQLLVAVRKDRQRRAVRRPIYLHSDASQAAAYLDLNVDRLGADLLTISGSKIYGPKQTACLFVKSGIRLEPIIYGGGQERGLRSGTENVAGAIGLAKALSIAQQQKAKEVSRLGQLQRFLIEELDRFKLVTINGDLKRRIPANLSLAIEGMNGEKLVHYLDQRGIQVATGAACSANGDRLSHVLLALGLSPVKVNSSLRISFGRHTTKSQLATFIRELKAVIKILSAQTV